MFTILQQREIFHLLFLKQFVKRIQPNTYALKGGSNLRFFYNSIRYSEDMDLDIKEIETFKLKDLVMEILQSKTLETTLKPFQIYKILPPDIKKAKQTETVQRFKIHLITSADENLFTKIEFSKRKLESRFKLEPVRLEVLRAYRQPPLMVAHYSLDLALEQKIRALAGRAHTQARDVFDLFNLYSQIQKKDLLRIKKSFSSETLQSAKERLLKLSYEIFKDTVCSYLDFKDRKYYEQREMWEEIWLHVDEMLSESS